MEAGDDLWLLGPMETSDELGGLGCLRPGLEWPGWAYGGR